MAGFTGALLDRLENIETVIRQLLRAKNNLLREGKVTAVFDDGTVEVDMQGLASDRLPQLTRAGNLTEWAPLSEGERVLVLNPTGEAGRGLVLPGGYTDNFGQPHDKLGEWFKGVSGTSMKMTDEELTLSATTIRLVGNVKIEGDVLTHNSKNVGDDHKHKDVLAGPANTGEPV